jgi:multicomponent Na+:H+ antiporter subunit F
MTFGPTELFLIGIAVLAFAILLALLRLFLGPTSPDRVVALDTVNTMVVGLMVAFAAYFEQVVFVDIAVVYALLSFGATMFIARYIEQTKEKEGAS